MPVFFWSIATTEKLLKIANKIFLASLYSGKDGKNM
jgi:hypothetical protein